nr:hypothetical protein BaRGS_031722 [Batillaria attramentaria]
MSGAETVSPAREQTNIDEITDDDDDEILDIDDTNDELMFGEADNSQRHKADDSDDKIDADDEEIDIDDDGFDETRSNDQGVGAVMSGGAGGGALNGLQAGKSRALLGNMTPRDFLQRIFPAHNPNVLELVWQGCGGNLERAIEQLASVSVSVCLCVF